MLENSVLPNYWTEKLTDACQSWACPDYLGCPNVNEYMPGPALASINGMGTGSVAQRIVELLDAPLGSEREDTMVEARDGC